jgi:hypothetical protein
VPEVERRLAERGVRGEEATALVDAVLTAQTAADTASRRARTRAALIQGLALCAGAVALLGFAFSPVAADHYRLPLIAVSGPLLLWGVIRLVQARM